MKKIIAVILAVALCLSLLAACGGSPSEPPAPESPTPEGIPAPKSPVPETEPPEEGGGCAHEEHDEKTLLCMQCGLPVAHDYLAGKCNLCPSLTSFITTEVEQQWRSDNAKAGTVVSHFYDTRSYIVEEKLGLENVYTQKRLNVYIPYGYEAGVAEGKKYNVLYLIPGGQLDEDAWLTTDVKNLLDNMIAEELIEPLLVVMPTYAYREGQFGGHEITIENPGDIDLLLDLFALELREYIIPFVETEYAAYADDPEDTASLQATRAHRAIAGFSAGGGCTYIAGIQNNLDIFSYFGIFSASMGRYVNVRPLTEILSEFEGFPIEYLYNGNGTKDTAYEWHLPFYFAWVADGAVVDHVNADLVVKPGMAHNMAEAGITDLFNALPMFFRK